MRQRIFPADIASGSANYDSQLTFVVHEFDAGRTPGDAAMTDDTARAFQEYERLFLGTERKLFRVISVVETECDDRARLKGTQPDHFLF
jgi:hypothetical protein